jgi:CheY-like chemotaxis protein
LAHEILRRKGYRVLEARHGEEALGIFEREAETIHLMVTDIVMPRMNGRELAARAREMRPDLRVLFMSGYTEDAASNESRIEEGAAFLEKPFTPDGLVRRVRHMLDAPGTDR